MAKPEPPTRAQYLVHMHTLAETKPGGHWGAAVDCDAALRELVRELVDKADVPDALVTKEWREIVARAKAATNV